MRIRFSQVLQEVMCQQRLRLHRPRCASLRALPGIFRPDTACPCMALQGMAPLGTAYRATESPRLALQGALPPHPFRRFQETHRTRTGRLCLTCLCPATRFPLECRNEEIFLPMKIIGSRTVRYLSFTYPNSSSQYY